MALPQIYEGTAEEIAEQLHSSNLQGKLKAIVTTDKEVPSALPEESERLDVALAALLEAAKHIEYETPILSTDPQKRAVCEIIDEKYRKTGFKL